MSNNGSSYPRWHNTTATSDASHGQILAKSARKTFPARSHKENRAIPTPTAYSTVLLVPQSNSSGGTKYSTTSASLLGLTSSVISNSTSILATLTSIVPATSTSDPPPSTSISVAAVCRASLSVTNAARSVSNTTPSTTMPLQSRATNKTFSNSWVYQGCYTEGTDARALPSTTYASDSMTLESCAAFCEGSYMMGVEYERECYCSDLLSAGSVPTPNQADCSMLCMGNSTESCGGTSLLQLYFAMTATGTPATVVLPQNPSSSANITSTIDPCATASSTPTRIIANPLTSPTSLPITTSQHNTSLSTPAKAGMGTGVALAVLSIALAVFLLFRRKRIPNFLQRKNLNSDTSHSSIAPQYSKSVQYPRANEKLRGDSDHSRENIVDDDGVVWPSPVVLKGEAKELSEWTEKCRKDYKMRMGLRNARPEESGYLAGQVGNLVDGTGGSGVGMQEGESGVSEDVSAANLARQERQRSLNRRRQELSSWV